MDDMEELRRRLREAESRAEEQQRRREAAEELATKSQPQTLPQYLETCHALHLDIQVITGPTCTTQGEPTKPTGRIFPQRIVPWHDFAARQEEIWDDLAISNQFFSMPAFPSQHQMEYVKSLLRPISSELGLRDFEHDVVENAVLKLVDRAFMDPLLLRRLGLQGTVTFESHTNLGTTDDSLGAESSGAAVPASAPKPKTRPKARGKGNRADQFCIYRTRDGQNVPVLAIEYKPPHKVTVDDIVAGLGSEIHLERDVINKDGQGPSFMARRLAAAVITQLFSYLIGKGIQYGYVCTGEALVFLHIPDDPSTVYYSICVPNQDVMDDDETRLHRTAVAQVFAFILQALRAGPPPQKWQEKAEELGIWPVEVDDVLKNIPVTERKGKGPRASLYKPQRWKGFTRSPIRTRSRGCKQPDLGAGLPDEDDDGPPSPTPNPSRTGGKAVPPTGNQGRHRGKQQPSGPATKQDIQSRPFCTHRCLLGLAYCGPTDKDCPNADHHGQGHINRREFLRLVRNQLATDRGADADCAPLYISGSRGSLFKVRLSSHGYTLVAKGVESLYLGYLQHENKMYDRLRPIQGKHVPVCLGSIDLIKPYYYDCGVFTHFMFLSWAGKSLNVCADRVSEAGLDDAVSTIFKAVHKLRILQGDAEPRNILYDTDSGKVMVVDFERAEFRGRQPLGARAPNVQSRKRKRGTVQKQERANDDFARELGSAVEGVRRVLQGCAVRQSLV